MADNIREFQRRQYLTRIDLIDEEDLSEADRIELDQIRDEIWTDRINFPSRGAGRISANPNFAFLYRARQREMSQSSIDLGEADLTEAILSGAKYNRSTKWPEGFKPIEHGAIPVEEEGESNPEAVDTPVSGPTDSEPKG